MAAYIAWWIVAAVLVGVELASGSFYLLVYGLAALGAGGAAWLGAGLVAQLLVAGAIALVGTVALRVWRGSRSASTLQDMDIGQPVRVELWHGNRGHVQYRGAVWDAEVESDAVDMGRPLVIRALRGNTLILGN